MKAAFSLWQSLRDGHHALAHNVVIEPDGKGARLVESRRRQVCYLCGGGCNGIEAAAERCYARRTEGGLGLGGAERLFVENVLRQGVVGDEG